MLKLFPTAKFRRDYKRCKRRGLDMQLLETVLDTLQREEPLDAKYHDHQLSGKYNKFRECHIQPDWLLIYHVDGDALVLTASRTGTHSDLLDM